MTIKTVEKEKKCFSIMLPAGISGGGYIMFSPWITFASVISEDEAIARLQASNVAGHEKLGFVVYDDDTNIDVARALSVISCFITAARGEMPLDREVIAIKSRSFNTALEHGFDPGKATLVADLRKEPLLDTRISIENFKVESDKDGYLDEAEFTGVVPDQIALVFGREQVIEAITHAYFYVLGAEERLDIPQDIDVLKNMSFGHRSMVPEEFSLDNRNSNPYTSLIREFAITESALAENEVYRSYKKMADEINDLSKIWETAQLENAIGVRVERRRESDDPLVEVKVLEAAMEKVADFLGIRHMVDAYYDGVPIDDILAK